MSEWHLLASLGTAVVGALAFLRVAANEIGMREREIEHRRRAEAALKPPPGADPAKEEMVTTRAA